MPGRPINMNTFAAQMGFAGPFLVHLGAYVQASPDVLYARVRGGAYPCVRSPGPDKNKKVALIHTATSHRPIYF